MVMLLYVLNKKLGGLPWQEWSMPLLGLTAASILTGIQAWGILGLSQKFWGTEGMLIQLVQLSLASLGGLAIFAVCAYQMKLPEVDMFVDRIRRRFGK
ncbi:MAG: hypothetical protein HC849_33005 [Oscillatoriales cyanobacterium RU_3_3]|nr:hypothetical protein [Oscillatoriales cyanobacterium RU_3_3]